MLGNPQPAFADELAYDCGVPYSRGKITLPVSKKLNARRKLLFFLSRETVRLRGRNSRIHCICWISGVWCMCVGVHVHVGSGRKGGDEARGVSAGAGGVEAADHEVVGVRHGVGRLAAWPGAHPPNFPSTK